MSVKKMILVPAEQQQQQISSTSLVQQQPTTSLLVDPFQKRLIDLDHEMGEILHDRNLNADEKVTRYLILLRTFLMVRAKMSGVSADPIPVRMVGEVKTDESLDDQMKGHLQSAEKRIETLSSSKKPRSVKTYSKTNILKGVKPRDRIRAKIILDSLDRSRDFDWDPTSGQIFIKDRMMPPTADLRQLLLHKVAEDHSSSSSHPPLHYDEFKKFLEKENISTIKSLRSSQAKEADVVLSTAPKVIEGKTRKRHQHRLVSGVEQPQTKTRKQHQHRVEVEKFLSSISAEDRAKFNEQYRKHRQEKQGRGVINWKRVHFVKF